MSARITRAIIERDIELVKSAAKNSGITVLMHGGYPVESLHLYGAMGTWWLMATHPGSTGTGNVGYARGLRDVHTFLQGMYMGLDAARHTKIERAARRADSKHDA